MFSNVSLSLSFRRLDRGAFLKAREIGRPRIKLAETREIKYRGPRSWRRSCEPLAVVNSTALSRYSYTRKCSEGWLSHFSHANSEPAIVVVSPFKIYCFVETVPCPPPLSLNTTALLSSPSDARGSRRNGSIFRSLHRNCLLNLFPYISLNFHACKIYEITSTVVAIIFLLLILQCRILYIHVYTRTYRSKLESRIRLNSEIHKSAQGFRCARYFKTAYCGTGRGTTLAQNALYKLCPRTAVECVNLSCFFSKIPQAEREDSSVITIIYERNSSLVLTSRRIKRFFLSNSWKKKRWMEECRPNRMIAHRISKKFLLMCIYLEKELVNSAILSG